jgi:uncharacterized protein DUF6335
MAKRKASRPTRTAARTRSGGTRARARSGAKGAASRKSARKAKRTVRPARRKTATRAAKVAVARKAVRKVARKAPGKAARASSALKAPASSARKAPASSARKAPAKAPARNAAAGRVTTRPAARMAAAPKSLPMRKAPALERARRTVMDDDIVQTPPSSLDLDRSASAIRTGRRELRDRFAQHTETSPALTGGDVDADWESAYSVGDEAPGGDNPTPDQDIVDDIGHAIGVEYQDNEELKGEAKISKRDRNRWELDPASSDDWDDR